MKPLHKLTLRIAGLIAGLAILLVGSNSLKAEQNLPKVQGLVNDYAGVLSDKEFNTLTQKLRKLEDSTRIQITVVFEETHQRYGAFDRAMFLARGWDVGDKEDRSGVFLYIAIKDRDYFIVTSDRTQGVLPDGFVGIVRDEFLKPNFRNEDYYEGVDQATDAIIQAMQGEFKSKNGSYTYTYRSEGSGWAALFVMLFIPILFFIVLFRVFKAVRRGVTMGGGNSGCLNALLLNALLNSGRSSRSSSWGSSSDSGWGGGSGFRLGWFWRWRQWV